MKRYFIALEGEIPVLDCDLTDEDFDYAGIDPTAEHTEKEREEAAEYAAQRIVRHTGFEVHDYHLLGSDER